MRDARVSPSSALRQLPLVLIAVLSCALSFWLTMRFCAELAPGQTAYELLAIGVIWELSKVTFGTLGMHALAAGPLAHRARALFLVVMSVVLAGGSIASSLGFLVQTESHSEERALASSQAYRRGQADLAAIDSELAVLTTAAAQDVSQNFRARGLRTTERIAQLRKERGRVSASLASQEAHPSAAGSSRFFANIGAQLPGDAHANAGRLRLGAQCVLAVMLELVSLIALALLRRPRHARQSMQDASGGAGLHLVHASPDAEPGCIENDAASRIGARRIAPQNRGGRGDTATDVPGKNSRYLRAKDMIARDQLKPSYRPMQRQLDISQSTAQRFLRDMEQEGFLTRIGRAYALAGAQ